APGPADRSLGRGRLPRTRRGASALVGEGRVHLAGDVRELLRAFHVAEDLRQIATNAELPLHEPLDRLEVAVDHVLPPRVGSPDHELGRVRPRLIDYATAPASPV